MAAIANTPQSPAVTAQHKARPSGALKGSLIYKLANAIQNKVTHLYWKTPEYQHYRYRQGQLSALASHRRTASATSDSAGRFRHGSTRSYTLRRNPSTSLQNAVKIRFTVCTGKHLNINITDTGKGNYRRWQATGGQRVQRAILPDGFGMAALEVTLCGETPPPPNGGSPRTERSPLPCGHLPTPWGVTPFRGGLCTSLRGNVADFHEESSKSIDKTVKMDYNCKGSPTKNRFSASLP